MTSFAERYGPWAVVAGASEGLGEAFARGCAARGLNVVLIARRVELATHLVVRESTAAPRPAAHRFTAKEADAGNRGT